MLQVAPFFCGSCDPVACPEFSSGPDVATGCDCKARRRGAEPKTSFYRGELFLSTFDAYMEYIRVTFNDF